MNLKNRKFINILNGFQNVWVKDSVYKIRGIRSNKYVPALNTNVKTIFKPRNIRSNAYTALLFK